MIKGGGPHQTMNKYISIGIHICVSVSAKVISLPSDCNYVRTSKFTLLCVDSLLRRDLQLGQGLGFGAEDLAP